MSKDVCTKPAGFDMDNRPIKVCDRIEIHPRFDLWMRGAQYGRIHKVNTDGSIMIRMDNPRVRRLQRMRPDDVKRQR